MFYFEKYILKSMEKILHRTHEYDIPNDEPTSHDLRIARTVMQCLFFALIVGMGAVFYSGVTAVNAILE